MSRISRTLMTTLFLAGTVAACESKRDETREETPAGSTVPAQTTPPGTTPRADQPVTTDQPGGMAPGTTAPGTMPPGGTTAPGGMAGHDMGSMSADMSDAQIAAALSVANQAEIDGSKLAVSKATDKDVKAFAQMMIKDHGKAEDDGKALYSKLALSPEEGEHSKQMKTEATTTMDRLRGMAGAEFDKAYIADQVQAHQKLLDHLDKMMISNADNPELKKHLEAVRPVIATHLAEAKRIEGRLTSAAAPSPAPSP